MFPSIFVKKQEIQILTGRAGLFDIHYSSMLNFNSE